MSGPDPIAGPLLRPFVFSGAAPYAMCTAAGGGVTRVDIPGAPKYFIRPVRCKTGVAAARTAMIPHLVESAVSVMIGSNMRFAARWQCSGGTVDAVFLPADINLGGMCPRCGDPSIASGPGVYRAFGHDGGLLYVGSARNLRRRVAQQRTSAKWRHLIGEVSTEGFPSLTAAVAAEAQAIATEKPQFNRLGVVRRSA